MEETTWESSEEHTDTHLHLIEPGEIQLTAGRKISIHLYFNIHPLMYPYPSTLCWTIVNNIYSWMNLPVRVDHYIPIQVAPGSPGSPGSVGKGNCIDVGSTEWTCGGVRCGGRKKMKGDRWASHRNGRIDSPEQMRCFFPEGDQRT